MQISENTVSHNIDIITVFSESIMFQHIESKYHNHINAKMGRGEASHPPPLGIDFLLEVVQVECFILC